jgi:hypothetical protein
MSLFGEIYGFSNEIVFSLVNIGNNASITISLQFKINIITNRYRISAFYSFNAEFAPYPALITFGILISYDIPAPG